MRIVECTVLQLMLNEEFVESAGTLCIGGRHRSRASNDALVVASFEGGGALECVSGRRKASRAGAGLRTIPTTLRKQRFQAVLGSLAGPKYDSTGLRNPSFLPATALRLHCADEW